MKKLLGTLLLTLTAFTSPIIAAKPISAQQKHIDAYTWQEQKMFNLTGYWIDVKVKPWADMKDKNVWGDTSFDDGGAHIEIADLNSYPASMPESARQAFQDTVLQHEMMHVYMMVKNVPEEIQDKIIYLMQPFFRKK